MTVFFFSFFFLGRGGALLYIQQVIVLDLEAEIMNLV